MSLSGTLPPARLRLRTLVRGLDRWTLHAMNPPRQLSHPAATRH